MDNKLIGFGALLAAALLLVPHRRGKHKQLLGPSSDEPWLAVHIVQGTAAGQVFEFDEHSVVSVGRRDNNAIVIQDTGVSGNHFEIAYSAEAGAWQLVDLGSLNGTSLNVITITSSSGRSDPYSLRDKDKILLGENTKLSVSCKPTAATMPDATTLGDLLAYDLMSLVERNPVAPAVQASLQTIKYPALRLKGASLQKQASGNREKKTCEDTFSFFCPVPGYTDLGLICLCDGHCGDETAKHVQAILPSVFVERLQARAPAMSNGASGSPPNFADVLHDTFIEVDRLVEGKDGCTMSVVAFNAAERGSVCIQAANVGDSAVVCADFSQMMKMHLTDSHRVTQAKEKERLKETGSLLTHNGTRLMGLNLSRSIGDRVLKDMNPGFLAAPYISTIVRVESQDTLLLIIASDGLWDVTNANIVMRIAYRVLTVHPGDLELLCKVLLQHALIRRSNDDITISVIAIDGQDEPLTSSS